MGAGVTEKGNRIMTGTTNITMDTGDTLETQLLKCQNRIAELERRMRQSNNSLAESCSLILKLRQMKTPVTPSFKEVQNACATWLLTTEYAEKEQALSYIVWSNAVNWTLQRVME